MEFFLVIIIALILLKPQDAQQFARWLGKFLHAKNTWKIRAERWLNSIEK